MRPSKKQIENAARLVPEYVVEIDGRFDVYSVVHNSQRHRSWQPWADTEAGRSDALLLLAAVYKKSMEMTPATCLCEDCAPWYVAVIHSLESGNVQQIQQSTMAAAVAIGEFLTREEGK